MAKTAFLFPGQGSQTVGMGRDLHDEFGFVREIFDAASDAAGLDLRRLCFSGPLEELTLTRNLQPAMAAVNHALFAVLAREQRLPDFAAGHSLGEYNAYAAAGVLEPAGMFGAVALRGKLMDRAAEEKPGAMAAVLGPGPEAVEEALEGLRREGEEVWAANFNTPAQTVITGSNGSVKKAGEILSQGRARVMPLAVSGAWHCPFMARANEEFGEFLSDLDFSAPAFPLVLNVSGAPCEDPREMAALAKKQLVSPVRWTETVRALLSAGVTCFVELGPKKVLGQMVKKIADEPGELSILSIGGLDELSAFLSR